MRWREGKQRRKGGEWDAGEVKERRLETEDVLVAKEETGRIRGGELRVGRGGGELEGGENGKR